MCLNCGSERNPGENEEDLIMYSGRVVSSSEWLLIRKNLLDKGTSAVILIGDGTHSKQLVRLYGSRQGLGS